MEIGNEINRLFYEHRKQFLYYEFSIGVTAQEAKTLELNDEQFVCPACRGILIYYKIICISSSCSLIFLLGISYSPKKQVNLSEESTPLKRKHSDETLPQKFSPNQATKHLKPSIILKRALVPVYIELFLIELKYKTLPFCLGITKLLYCSRMHYLCKIRLGLLFTCLHSSSYQ
jgi:hypothetical protein